MTPSIEAAYRVLDISKVFFIDQDDDMFFTTLREMNLKNITLYVDEKRLKDSLFTIDRDAGLDLKESNPTPTDLESLIEYANELLLPLAEACISLDGIVHNLSFYIQMAVEETPKEPSDNLTIDENTAIRLYSVEWTAPHRSLDSMLNYTLQTCSRSELQPYFKHIKLFLIPLTKLLYIPPLTVWRSMVKNLSADFFPGTPVTWWEDNM
ncbi:unnamed protein product [Adineta ricciae]|uniref:Uncharacterized protein n=1 Tax=Adineta ricciae TaxID=249248 RepID=A0A813QNI2_ADIRI|nr:unnamed protein product [Adineta ricciae]CAF1479376.1 unnamed protein product [Adineta ricciae]